MSRKQGKVRYVCFEGGKDRSGLLPFRPGCQAESHHGVTPIPTWESRRYTTGMEFYLTTTLSSQTACWAEDKVFSDTHFNECRPGETGWLREV